MVNIDLNNKAMMSAKASGYPKPFSGQITWDRSFLIQKETFAFVYRGVYDNDNVRVKRIEEYRVQQERNVDLQANLKHENIVKILTIEHNEDFWYCTNFLFLMKYSLHNIRKNLK